MRPFRFALAGLLWILVVLCLGLTALPHFLDRIYYRGAPTPHFDGARFANPDGADTDLAPATRNRFVARRLFGDADQPAWPSHVAVTPSRPPARVEGGDMRVTWIGHATVLVQADGLNILTDPVWSEKAGPLGFGPQRVAAPGVRFEDLPKIDLVLVSHNHYDHMDLATLKRLWDRDKPIIVTSLGNDSLIRAAGIPGRHDVTDCGDCPGVEALDWGESTPAARFDNPWSGESQKSRERLAIVTVTRNHHWSSRWFADRNRALWSSFVVQLPHGNFFFAGDTGAGDMRWPAEAAALGPIRFAAIPIGAFRFEPGQMAAGSHIGPRDAIRVWDALGRPAALPIHWGTFRLSREAYATPPRMLRQMLRCARSNPARFAPAAIGVPVTIPPLQPAPPRPDIAGVDACARAGAFDALR